MKPVAGASVELNHMHVQRVIEKSPALGKDTLNEEGTAINGLEPGVSGERKWASEGEIWPATAYPSMREFKGEEYIGIRGRFRIK